MVDNVSRRKSLGILIPVAFIAVLVLSFGIINPRFLSIANVYNLIRQTSVLMIVAIGATFVILMGSIDLSVGAIITISGIVSAVFVPKMGTGAIVAGVAIGGLAGAINGLVFVYGRVPSFLVTLAMGPILEGLALIICKGSPVVIKDMNFLKIASGKLIGNFPNIGIWAILIYCFFTFVAFRTRYGRYVFTIGAGEKASQFSGVSVRRIKIITFFVSGFLSGLAGVLFSARCQSGTARMGEPFILDSIAATVVGGTALTGGSGGPHRTILGVIIMGILSNGMNLLNVHPHVQIIIKGVVTILAVAATLDRSRLEFVK
jgi:ribose/xylose/arabinose/galactoside ABC-type transport system permease subunit